MTALPAHKCPLCGSVLEAADPHYVLRETAFGPVAQRIVDRLLQSFGRWVYSEQLLQAAYGDDPNGGPDSGNNALRPNITHLRAKLKPLGYEIEFANRGPRRLVRR